MEAVKKGDIKTMDCLLDAEVTEVKKGERELEVDVKFENGASRKNRPARLYGVGKISPKVDKTGEVIVQNCDLKATVIEYGNSRDITIQFETGFIREDEDITLYFENGEIREHADYRHFKT